MLRDFKFIRRNSSIFNLEEVENLPVNPNNCSSNPRISLDSSRPALIPIQDPCQTSKCVPEQEMSRIKTNRFDKTTTKLNPRSVSLKTPEKSKKRFGWAQKSDQHHVGVESKDGGKAVMNVGTPARRGVGRANSECNLTQSTPTKSVCKVTNGGLCLASGSRPPLSHGGSNRMANFTSLSKGIPSSCNSPAVVNSVEVPYFALKEDSSFWMDHNVQVLIRVRPLNNMEKSSCSFSRCLKQESSQCITWIGQPETRFTFDHVACEAIEQETLFRMVGLPMVENCLSGYNSCMFAYGQTGSGKTFTMLGEIDGLEVNPSPNRGMIPRIFEFLFARIREEEECRRNERLKYTCKCSFLEIYNEQITDLLDPTATNLMLREDMNKGVYVENLSEFEVHTVGDILHLLSEGSSNRRVASTNMNKESSRSHSVFTCVIESSWEKDSTSNFRFARLNLVDLAGSERQKSSGAEGERLKEAANINRSLSTLGHVIMVLVDVAHGKTKHIPYRDSRLTFLLQDSLGGNSKTIIIANVSPSICSAAETLNTLKFAQRAKMIQNNAIINEDSSGDVSALRLQIRILKEELSALKHERVNRSLSFGHDIHGDRRNKDEDDCNEQMLGNESHGVLRVSCKQLKSLETSLVGAFRREQMAETFIKQLEAEIEQLNRLVSQREEDTRCTKMMLKFREDKIQRLESVIGGSFSADDYLVEENFALSEEIKLLRAKIDKNPEVTRFALENIRLLEQVRWFQDLYEGEREVLMSEITELRNQLIFFVDANSKHSNHLDMKGSVSPAHASDDNNFIQEELKRIISELEESKAKLASCLDENEKLRRELEELHASSTSAFAQEHDCSTEVIKESIVEVPSSNNQLIPSTHRDKEETKRCDLTKHVEEITNLQLELDILKIILQEERSHRVETEEKSKEMIISATKEYEKVQEELKEAKLIIEALESQQLLSINEIDDLRNSNIQYEELLNKKELEVSSLTSLNKEESRLEAKLKQMHESLERAKIMNQCYQSGISGRNSKEEETEEVRKQVEVETAEVIVCLQEELSFIQQKVNDSKIKEVETEGSLKFLQTEMKILEDHLRLKTEENERLVEMVRERENKFRIFSEEREVIGDEIEGILSGGTESLQEAQELIDYITISFPDKSSWVMERFGHIKKYVAEKEMAVEKLHQCLEDAMESRNVLENMLRSLRGAALVITETHQQESIEKEKEIFLLMSKLDELERKIKNGEDRLGMASSCATAALVIVNRFSEIISQKDVAFNNQVNIISVGHAKAHSLQKDLEASEDCCSKLMTQLSDEQKRLEALRVKLEETEAELNDVKVIASQKSIETSCILEKFREVQDTMKEADIMINDLMIANEVLKHNACQLKERESKLFGEKDTLVNEIETLKSSNIKKDENYMKLEKQYDEEFDIMKNKLIELEQFFLEISTSSMEKWMSLSSDFHSIMSHFHGSTEFIKSLIEELWSEIIVKDCAVSVLHLCHMGNLLETANCLNAENGLLQNGLCKSNASISELTEHNTKSQRELEICRNLSGKLLTDIKNGLDRVSSKVDEDGEFTLQFKYFEKKIEDLQFLEEMMLEKSNEMGSKLVVLMKELDQGNRQAMASLVEQELLLKDKDELFDKRDECLSVEILVKDFESVILSSELMHMSSTCIGLTEGLESFKKDIIFKSIDAFSNELILMEEFKMKETALHLNTQKLKDDIFTLQMNLVKKDEELGKMKCIEEENKLLKGQFEEHKKKYYVLLQELEGKNDNMENYQLSQTVESDLCSRIRDLETQLENVSSAKNGNISLRIEPNEISESEYPTALSLQKSNSIVLAKNVDAISSKIINLINKRFVDIDGMFQQTVKEVEKTHIILEQFNNLWNIDSHLDSEVVAVQMEMSRKNDIVKGLLFDLSMLQEPASNCKDQKDETEEPKDSLMSLERDFELKSVYLDEAMTDNQILELEIMRHQENISSLSSENCEIHSSAKDSLEARISMEKELKDARIKCENLEIEITDRENALARMSETIVSLKSNLEKVTVQADNLDSEVCVLKKELESTRTLAEEHKAIAAEAQETAELRKVHAEEKEEEVRLLERSIQELVDFVKGEAERERLEREELEMKLLSRVVEEKEKKLDALEKVQLLEREILPPSRPKLPTSLKNLSQAWGGTEGVTTKEDEIENANHKKRLTELEMEVKKLSGHHNIQQRIHHHAKIKDENNLLRLQNEELSTKLRKTEAILSRVKEELVQFRAANGRNQYIDFDEEEGLNKKLKETEEERLQLAGKLLSLCTTVLKAAGIRRPASEINLSVAEEALHLLKNRVVSLEMELQDAKLKNRISDERSRMLERRAQSSYIYIG